jgi:hypothetical protein
MAVQDIALDPYPAVTDTVPWVEAADGSSMTRELRSSCSHTNGGWTPVTRMTIEKDKIRENKGFREVSDRDIETEEMSGRRQADQLGMMNREFDTE